MNDLATRDGLLFEFALTPDAIDAAVSGLDKAKRDTVVLALRNMRVNGLLANLRNGEWIELVKQKLQQASDQEARVQIKVCLNRLKDRSRIVLHPIQPGEASESSWIDAALASHLRFGMSGIFVDEPGARMASGKRGADAVVPIGGAVHSRQWGLFRKSTVAINKTSADYRRVLSTVLAYANWVIVVDRFQQYGHPEVGRSWSMAAIELISKLLGARRTRVAIPHATVLLRAAEVGQRPEGRSVDDHYVHGWADALSPLAQRFGIRYLVYVEPGPGTIHNRFIFTNQCGMMIGDSQGLYHEGDARPDDWALLDDDHMRQRLQECDFRADPCVRKYLEVTANDSRIVEREHE